MTRSLDWQDLSLCHCRMKEMKPKFTVNENPQHSLAEFLHSWLKRYDYMTTASDVHGHSVRSPVRRGTTLNSCTAIATSAVSLVPNSTTRTPAMDMLYNSTNGRAHSNSTTCCTTNSPPTDKNLPHHNILTCRDALRRGRFAVQQVENCCQLVRWWCINNMSHSQLI